ncbi:MAG: hypothetical protein LBM06_02625 [Prevotellaceae bacterium]|jgi:hypothetical protein|nr:hypothetical protein [Prevotellaceae bacterium]
MTKFIKVNSPTKLPRNIPVNEATGLFPDLIADGEGRFSKVVRTMNLWLLVSDLKEANSKLQQLSENRLSPDFLFRK